MSNITKQITFIYLWASTVTSLILIDAKGSVVAGVCILTFNIVLSLTLIYKHIQLRDRSGKHE